MRCEGLPQNFDPWLSEPRLKCRGTQLNAQGEFALKTVLVNALMEQIQRQQRPFTARHPFDRNGLVAKRNADLQREAAPVPRLQTKANPLAISNAPIIHSPQTDTRITSSNFKIHITASKMLTGSHILVQFTKMDGSANTLKPTYSWRRPTSELAEGTYFPTDIVNSNGNWSLRARIDAPKPGDFSADVPFIYAVPPIAILPRKNIDIYRR